MGPGSHFMNRLDALGSDDVWAVGAYTEDNINNKGIVMHWDGEDWKMPHLPTFFNGTSLNDVTAASADDVWVVGGRKTDSTNVPFLAHWDGKSWSEVPSPSSGVNDVLYGAHAIATDDVWAVGDVLLHWDGSEWTHIATPGDFSASDVGGVVGNDVWLTGEETWHWDGNTLQKVPTANDVGLDRVEVTPENDPWGAGNADFNTMLVQNWNGTAWQQVGDIPRVADSSRLTGIAVESATNVWATGMFFDQANFKGFILNGQSPRVPERTGLVSPARKKTVTEDTVTLRWQGDDCALRYEVEVREGRHGDVVVSETNVRAQRLKLDTIEPDTKYFWRVRGCNEQGCGQW